MSFMDEYLSPTNTFASTPFDVLKVDGVEDPLIDVNKLATIDINESFFAMCVDFVNESHKELTDAKLTLYKSLSEASTETVVLESFSSFFSAVKDIIDKFLKFLKQIIERFWITINKLVKSDKFLKKRKDDFRKFNEDCEFDITGYEYTFNPDVPLANAVLDITKDFYSNLRPENSNMSADYIKSLNDQFKYNETWYDGFRARLLKKDGEYITANDFGEELFKVFRNDTMDTDSITITSDIVIDAYRRYDNYDDLRKQTERERKDIERSYNRLQDDIKRLSNKSNLTPAAIHNMLDNSNAAYNKIDGVDPTSGNPVSANFAIVFDIYAKNQVDKIQRCSDIHLLAYGAKLDALKEALKQDRATLYKALDMIERRGVK